MKTLFTIACALVLAATSLAQPGGIRGKIHTSDPNNALPYVTITALVDTHQVASTVSDISGNFIFSPLGPGMYNLQVSSIGFRPKRIDSVEVKSGAFTVTDIELEEASMHLDEVVITATRPLIDMANAATTQTMTFEEIQAAPVREVNALAGKVAGVQISKGKKNKNIRGSRSDAAAYYVDGVKVRGRFGLATQTGNEQYEGLPENDYADASSSPLSTFSIDVDAASYSNMRRFINGGSLPPPDAVRIEEMINYFTYSYPQPEHEQPFSITTEVSACPWNDKHQLVHIGLQGRVIDTEKLPPGNLVFLLDVSGSMDEPNKLPLVKKSFTLLVDQLRHEDRVAIVVYAGNAGLVLPSTRGDRKETILSAIDNLQAGGSTAGGEGIQLAYKVAMENFVKDGNNRVILATDGDFNVGISDDNSLVKLIESMRDQGIFLSVLGFGVGNYKDAKMEKLADKGNGNLAYIDNLLEAQKVFVKELGATLLTIAKDVKLQVEFNPAHVKAYRLVGYENRMLQDRDFNDDTKDAGELGAGASVTALYEIIPAGSAENVPGIDSLKYQRRALSTDNGEMLTVKFRYKDPGGIKSKLIEQPLSSALVPTESTSDNFRFSAAVAEFGMLLRESEHKGNATFNSVLALARNAKGPDTEGYRAEFIRLVEMAQLLKGTAGK